MRRLITIVCLIILCYPITSQAGDWIVQEDVDEMTDEVERIFLCPSGGELNPIMQTDPVLMLEYQISEGSGLFITGLNCPMRGFISETELMIRFDRAEPFVTVWYPDGGSYSQTIRNYGNQQLWADILDSEIMLIRVDNETWSFQVSGLQALLSEYNIPIP
ncbi:MAG: hypothetical protein ACLFR1_12080 [Spirochaetia bacterium]